jgi:hypothetical protein
MNKTLTLALGATVLLASLLSAGAVLAHGGEDHSAPVAAATSTSLPRVGVATDDFELVAVLEATRLLIYVDHSASNEPVTRAQIEVDGVGPSAHASEVASGVYALDLAQALATGSHALTFTIQTADNSDLLAATLVVPTIVSVRDPARTTAPLAVRPWMAGAGALATVGLLGLAIRRRKTLTAVR